MRIVPNLRHNFCCAHPFNHGDPALIAATGINDRHYLRKAGPCGNSIFAFLWHKLAAGKDSRRIVMIEFADDTGAFQRPADSRMTVTGPDDHQTFGIMRAVSLDDEFVDSQIAANDGPGEKHHDKCQDKRRPDDVPDGSTQHQVTRPTISEALVPPKPKLFDMALRTSRLRVFNGTRSKSATASSGACRLSVGGRSPVCTALIE